MELCAAELPSTSSCVFESWRDFPSSSGAKELSNEVSRYNSERGLSPSKPNSPYELTPTKLFQECLFLKVAAFLLEMTRGREQMFLVKQTSCRCIFLSQTARIEINISNRDKKHNRASDAFKRTCLLIKIPKNTSSQVFILRKKDIRNLVRAAFKIAVELKRANH